MKVFILASFLVVAISSSVAEEHGELFQTFKLKHGKTYRNQAEETRRFAIFKDNLRQIEEHNALFEQGLVSYEKGVNQFTDMTQEEFLSYLKLSSSNKPTIKGSLHEITGLEVPASVDWRTKGQVTAVKDQGQCGSCWSFAVVASTEAAYYRKTGKLVSLSEQQLVDCTTSINNGCNGGYLDQTFPYIEKNGLQSEASYPYTAKDGKCKYSASSVVTKVSSYKAIGRENESGLLDAVANEGPVAVAIDASYISAYKSGVFESNQCSKAQLNHGVTVVGYGSENGKNYWIVKNSWGASWGDHGYFKLLRGANECGVAEDTVYPTI